MTFYLLDTDTTSYLINGYSAAVAKHFDQTFPFQRAISVITYTEILTGLQIFPSGHQRLKAAGQFLATIRVLDWGADAASLFAYHWTRLEKAGNLIERFDTMIAAHALALDAVLITNNARHFSRLAPPLRMENWLA